MASRQFEPGRAVEVIYPTYGSAYRIGGRLVLTAAHLVAEVGSACRVRSKLRFGEAEAKVVWKAEAADIALIELDASIESWDAVVLGRLPEAGAGESLRFQMYGYPRWGRTQRAVERTAAGGRQIEGLIYLADSSPDGLLVLEPDRLPPEGSSTSGAALGSEWEGNSGAAIVCDGLVIAVQRQHQNPQRPASLEASLLWSIDADRQWRDLLERHGISPDLAIARLQATGAIRQISVPYFYPRDLGSRTFVGRSEELQALHGLMQSSSQVGIVAATGMGGIGKTELAWQYAHQHRGDYPSGIWWLSAASLVGEVLVYGVRMKLPKAPEQLEGDAARVQWYYDRWIEAIPEGKRLLVWDDVSDYGRVRSLLPQDERYRVLLTTRVRLGSPVQRLELGVLKQEEALELLGQLVGDRERMAAEAALAPALCEWVGYLPLGIELVGRHLAGRPTVELATLLVQLEAQRLQAKAVQQVPGEMPYQDNLAAAFELSWQLLDESAQRLGGLLSMFALAPVQRSWVAASLSEWEEEELEEAVGALFRWSLVSMEMESGAYLLHTLIREFFAEKLRGELRGETAALQRGMAVAMVAEAKTVEQTVTVSEVARVQGAVPHWQVVVAEFMASLEGSDALWCFIALGRVLQDRADGRKQKAGIGLV